MGSGNETVSGAELRVWVAWLGLTVANLAALLDVAVDLSAGWVDGRVPVPGWVGETMEQFDAFTVAVVDEVIAALNDSADVAVHVYRDDQSMWAARPEFEPWPASWWLMVVARATAEVPGADIAYTPAGG